MTADSPRARAASVLSGSADDAWLPPWLGPVLVAVAFVALARWSWGKWPDVQIDFGNQLYLPWALGLGKVLYRDIDYKEGPLSLYANAGLFALFGPSLRTLVWTNLALLGLLTALVYRLFARACGALTATAVCLVELVVFAFSQYTGGGNYNYVCPYTHEQTHGMLLGVGTLTCLVAYLERRRIGWAIAAGVAFGLLFLTKTELFVPALVASTLAFVLAWRVPPRPHVGIASRAPDATRHASGSTRGATPPAATTRDATSADLPLRSTSTAALAFAGAAALAVVPWFVGFACAMPLRLAARAVAGNWTHLGGGILRDPFYASGLGLDDVGGNLRSMATVFGAVVALVGVAAGVDRQLRRVAVPGIAIAALAVAATVAWIALGDRVPWRLVGRTLPPLSLVALATFTVLTLRARAPEARARFGALALWAAFALALLAKVVLNVRISQYGFVLAMPAALLLVACLVWLVPAVLRASGSGGRIAQALLVAPVVAAALFFFQWSNRVYARKDLVVGVGGDAFVAENPAADPRAAILAAAAERLRALVPPDATLLALPEGTMLNYWLRHENPTRYTLFTPSAIAFAGGEDVIVADLRAHPPDFIALVHRESDEFGVGYFGVDPRYGRTIMDWVRERYVPVDGVGAAPFRDGRFGVAILRRRPG